MLVVASVPAIALLDNGPDGGRLRCKDLAAPSLIDLEVVSVWRGLIRGGQAQPGRVSFALDDLRALPLQRVDHAPLVARCWELREDLAIYAASYLALAEALQAPLLTGDRRMARAPGPRCSIEVAR